MVKRERSRSRAGRILRRTAVATAAVTGAVTAFAAVGAAAANADTLSASTSAATFGRGIPATLTFASNAAAIDTSGDGPYLYALVQPTSAGGCQSTYGGDLQVVGTQATQLQAQATQVNTGQDSHSFSYTSYTPNSYTACAWLENDGSDHAGKGDTTANVTASTSIAFTVADQDSVSTTLSETNPLPGAEFTLTAAGNDTPISAGVGPYLYVVRQPLSAGSCGSTFGGDLQIVGGQADTLITGQEVNTGSFSIADTETSSAGQFEICTWLETDATDNPDKGDTPSVVTASSGPLDYTSVAPSAPSVTGASISGLSTARPRLAVAASGGSGDVKSVQISLPRGLAFSTSAKNLARDTSVKSNSGALRFSVSRDGATLIITPRSGAARVTVTVAYEALIESSSLKSSVQKKHTRSVSVTLKVTGTVGGTVTKKLKLRA